jgi:hypothetical protein
MFLYHTKVAHKITGNFDRNNIHHSCEVYTCIYEAGRVPHISLLFLNFAVFNHGNHGGMKVVMHEPFSVSCGYLIKMVNDQLYSKYMYGARASS